MALIDLQTALGRLVRAGAASSPVDELALDDRERAFVGVLRSSPGLHFTRAVQRSWCLDRAAKAAPVTFAVLPPLVRRRLLDDWVAAGGGTNSFVASEADALLDFVAAHLPDPSHALSVCRFEQAVLRAVDAMRTFVAPEIAALRDTPFRRVRRGRHAAIVTFHGDPRAILADLGRTRQLPLSAPTHHAVAPGITTLCRPVLSGERALWSRLVTPVHVAALGRFDPSAATLEAMLREGTLELVLPEPNTAMRSRSGSD